MREFFRNQAPKETELASFLNQKHFLFHYSVLSDLNKLNLAIFQIGNGFEVYR